MKKTTHKLHLNKSTIRVLQGEELMEVVGGSPTANCTQIQQQCSKTEIDCPPSNANKPGHHGCQSGNGYGCDKIP